MLSAKPNIVYDVSELPGCYPQLVWRHKWQETAQKVGQTSVTSHKLWVATWHLRNVKVHVEKKRIKGNVVSTVYFSKRNTQFIHFLLMS